MVFSSNYIDLHTDDMSKSMIDSMYIFQYIVYLYIFILQCVHVSFAYIEIQDAHKTN